MSRKKKRNTSHKTGASSFVEIPKDHRVFEGYMQCSRHNGPHGPYSGPHNGPYDGPQYDTINDCPIIAEETEMVRRVTYKKLAPDTRKLLRSVMEDLVVEYWQDKRQIPWNEVAKKFRQTAILLVYRLTGQYAKDSDELRRNFQECIIATINKELRKEQ